jgi:Zn-dependent protease/CBS domain-containing protein
MTYSSFKIGSVFGIPVRLHITFLLVLPIFALLFGEAYYPESDMKWVWGLLLTVALFAGVTLHELAHSYVAKKNGIPIESIVLLPLGGVSQMKEVPEDPNVEMRMTIVGPLTSILLGAVSFLCALPFKNTEVINFFVTMGWINVSLGLFNLLPAFPMDGGRILRTRLTKKYRYDIATKRAVSVGHALAVIMFITGVFLGAYGLLLMLGAMFVYIGGTEEERQTSVYFAVRNLKVRDAMRSEVDCLSESTKMSDAIEELLRTKHIMYPVVDGNGNYLGVVTLDQISGVQKEEREALLVKDVMVGAEPLSPEDSARDGIQKLTKSGFNRLPVVESGRVIGIVTIGDIIRTAQILNA